MSRWRVAALWLALVALAVAAALWLAPGPRVGPCHGETLPRTAVRGDVARVCASLRGDGELRVYRNRDELVLRCPGGASCAETGESGRRVLRGSVEVTAGRYDLVLLVGRAPEPTGDLNGDRRAAIARGVRVERSGPVTVR